MRLALITDAFPPMRSSGAVQLRDLARAMVARGHEVTVMVSTPGIDRPWLLEEIEGVRVLRLRTWPTRDTAYLRRMIGEFAMPHLMRRGLRKSPFDPGALDGIVWYSPTIFLGPIVRALKQQAGCPAYLIVRDIFPQWALDMGLLSRGPAYWLLDRVAEAQYAVADTIGVQTPGNLSFFARWAARPGRGLEVLHNWLGPPATGVPLSFRIDETAVTGRKLFVYAGNMGVAQDMGKILDLAGALRDNADIGFLFVGRGSDAAALRERAARDGLANVAFQDEIDPDAIPTLFSQCAVGIVSLDARHRTHNIPGKFLTYMQAGLPVLASVNANNDLVALIREEDVGTVGTDPTGRDLPALAVALAARADEAMAARARRLSARLFDVDRTVDQIIAAFRNGRGDRLAGEP